jgi:hypothetical protein
LNNNQLHFQKKKSSLNFQKRNPPFVPIDLLYEEKMFQTGLPSFSEAARKSEQLT